MCEGQCYTVKVSSVRGQSTTQRKMQQSELPRQLNHVQNIKCKQVTITDGYIDIRMNVQQHKTQNWKCTTHILRISAS